MSIKATYHVGTIVTLNHPKPPGHSQYNSHVWIIENVLINEMIIIILALDNFSAVLTIAIELLKQETLLYTKKQQVAVG